MITTSLLSDLAAVDVGNVCLSLCQKTASFRIISEMYRSISRSGIVSHYPQSCDKTRDEDLAMLQMGNVSHSFGELSPKLKKASKSNVRVQQTHAAPKVWSILECEKVISNQANPVGKVKLELRMTRFAGFF